MEGSSEGWTDLISDFLEYTAHLPTSEAFRLWSAVALVAGACERRVWFRTKVGTGYPSIYTMLVAPPGVGKQVIDITKELWRETLDPHTRQPAFRVGPDSITKASMMDCLGKSARAMPLGCPTQFTYHSMLVAAEEMGVLMPSYDNEFMASLNSIYNNPRMYEEARRTSLVKALKVDYPQLNLLLGAQPGWLGTVFPEEAWTSGFASRLFMVYTAASPLQSLLGENPNLEEKRSLILRRLGRLSQLWGEMEWAEGVLERIDKWHMLGGPPRPTHSKLQYYCNRRTFHLLKLCTISAIARTGRKVVREADLDRAMNWLLVAEDQMPDIFRAMIGKSDFQVVEELHFFLLQMWKRGGQKPIGFMSLRNFLLQRVPTQKIEQILEAAIGAGVIARVAGSDTFIPRPKHEHGVE